MGPWQLLLCILVAVLLFGGKKIPDLARSLGKAKGEFKKGLAEGEKADDEEEEKLSAPVAPKQVEKTA
jgi:sec-independent protein translocase protein TatA